MPVSSTAAALTQRANDHGIACSLTGPADAVADGCTHDSRAVGPGQLFVCLRGDAFDGHDFAGDAVRRGATALLVDHVLDEIDDTVAQLVVDDTRVAAGPIASLAWGDPSHELTIIGVTGTNGKTTTAQMAAALLRSAGFATGVIGTLHGARTTPEAPDLHRMLAEFRSDGCAAVVMEVSSHALALHRSDGTAFDVVGFSNLGHDHLDLHGTHEEYFRAKSALFTSANAPVGVFNIDDPHGRLLADTVAARDGNEAMRVVEVSTADVTDLEVGITQHRYTWQGHHVLVGVGGDFNVANSLLALALVGETGVDLSAALPGLATLDSVPGRFEIVDDPVASARGITVVVDYAHTPDGLETLLSTSRPLTSGQLICVFGCAGRRDREKRPVMGEIAARMSDAAIATSDNPRGEDPHEILDDVISGVAEQYRSRVTSEPDRRLAIREALSRAVQGDLVVVAGKGHERTQDLGHSTIEFDDRSVVREELHT